MTRSQFFSIRRILVLILLNHFGAFESLQAQCGGIAPYYSSDFNAGIDPYWSIGSGAAVPIQSGQVGAFGAEDLRFQSGGLPCHDSIIFSCDLITLGSWDGDGTYCCGPDIFIVSVDGVSVFATTFSCTGWAGNLQSYPDQYPAAIPHNEGSGGVSIAGGFMYHLSFVFPHNASTVDISISQPASQGVSDERWYMDNFSLEYYRCDNVTNYFNQDICPGDVIAWGGGVYAATGTYADTFPSSFGCDSIVVLDLQVHPPIDTFINISACEQYALNGVTYSSSGTHVFHLQSPYGCDSNVYVGLSIHQPVETFSYHTACHSFIWNGQTYFLSDTIVEQLTDRFGCDSTANQVVTIFQPTFSAFNQDACVEYSWGDSTYAASGVYQQVLVDVNGCDSTVTLTLTVFQIDSVLVDAQICSGESFMLPDGSSTGLAGDHRVTLSGVHGCDSVVVTRLTVNPLSSSRWDHDVCPSEVFTLPDGSAVVGAGVYETHFLNRFNCDSTVFTYLHEQAEPAWFLSSVTRSDSVIGTGDTAYFQVSTSNAAVLNYSWSPSYNLSCNDCPTPFFTGLHSAIYSVVSSDSNGCISRSTVSIEVQPEYDLYVPSGFTPNQDGLNDGWSVNGDFNAIGRFEVYVYDRWGLEIFKSDDKFFHWDATYQDEDVPGDVYDYLMMIEWKGRGAFDYRTGKLTVVR